MEVVPQGKRLPPIPFQRRDVEEWSTLDSLTGMLEHARVQTDHWAATTCNSSHHFGKVIDSRARNLADGSTEQRQQTKQLEVFQANIPGGSVQVIRSQSLTTSSWQGQSTTTKLGSGSGWSARANSKHDRKNDETEFDSLKLALNPLDLSSQKTKASVGRSGSISSRRPPSRPRSIAGSSRSDKPGQIMEEEEVADRNPNSRSNNNNNINNSSSLSQMSRICQKYHQEAKNHSLFQASSKSLSTNSKTTMKQSYMMNGSDSSINKNREKVKNTLPTSGHVTLSHLLESTKGKQSKFSENSNKKLNLVHKKSCSSEDLRLSPETQFLKTDGTDKNEDWKRTSKARRSLQFPVHTKTEQNSIINNNSNNNNANNNNNSNSEMSSDYNSVLKITKEIEARKKIVTNSLKNNHWTNIEDVLKKVVNNDNQNLEKPSNNNNNNNNNIENNAEDELIIKDNKLVKKKHTFITVESLKEVRGRLRRLGSPATDEIKYEEEDDGIVTESKDDSPTGELEGSSKSVKSYVYGMEALLRNRPTTITGTGSLESRSTNKSGTNGSSRSEEWYNRRKSYGFEQVNGQTSQKSNLYNDKNKVDSSTDSGICKSSETVANIPFWNKPLSTNGDGNNIKTSHLITIKRIQDKNDNVNNKEIQNKQDIYNTGTDCTQKGKKTVVTLGAASKSSSWNWNNQQNDDKIDEDSNTMQDDKKEVVTKGKIADAIRSLREKSSLLNGFESRRLSEPITISIPVSTIDNSEIIDNDELLLKQTKEPSTIEKFNLSKQNNEQSTEFSTSYSKLLYGTNNNSTNNDNNDQIKKPDNSISNNGIQLQISSWNRNSSIKENDFKRHSIAVDEARYMDNSNKELFDMPSVKDKIASFKNQFDLKPKSNEKLLLPVSSNNNILNDKDKNKLLPTENENDSNTNEKKQKKVEFCKTEVHFAAESGRFNIVETDGKPPSNNNFRRRRRTIAETPQRSNLPEIRFGDSQYEKELLTYCEANELDSETLQTQEIPSSSTYRLSPQFIDNEKDEECILTQGNTIMQMDNDYIEIKDDNIKINDINIQQDYEEKPRSILKNNIQKHQPHNVNVESIRPKNFEENDNTVVAGKASVSLKSVTTDFKTIPWRSTVTVQNPEDKETELQKLLKTLRPTPLKQNAVVTSYNTPSSNVESSATAADNGLAVRISSSMNLPDQRRASWSVAERVRTVEDLKSKGFSTKVNFGSGETTVVTPELRNSPVRDFLSTGWISDSVKTNDDLSRCIEEEIIEIPRPNKVVKPIINSINNNSKFFKETNSNENIFKIIEDFKSIQQNINNSNNDYKENRDNLKLSLNKLSNMNEIDSGEISDDSLKADEEVRSYMSAGNEGDNSDNDKDDIDDDFINDNKKIFKHINQIPNFDKNHVTKETVLPMKKPQHVVTSNVVPTYIGQTNKMKSVETLVSTRSGHPKITSISLRYTDDINNTDNKNVEKSPHITREEINKTNIYQTQMQSDSVHNIRVLKHEPSKITTYSPSDNISVSKACTTTSAIKKDIPDTEDKFKSSLNQLHSRQHEIVVPFENIKTKDDTTKQKVSQVVITNQKTKSPSSDSVFLERSSKQQSLYSQVTTSRNRSMSPVPFPIRPVNNLPDYANTRQIQMATKQSIPATVTATDSSVWSSVAVNKTKKKELMKTDDSIKKKQSDDSVTQKDRLQKNKERRLSSSSSGRDGWLNTPKESQMRQRVSSSQNKRQNNVEMKKEKKIISVTNKVESSGKTSMRQGSESPIYQNREVYSTIKKDNKDPYESLETESAILEELTRAADQILLAVNGYTDEESMKASSDDEYRRKHGKEKTLSKPLTTISEMPVKKKTTTAVKRENFSKISASPAQSSVGTSSRIRLCKTSSNSSVEGANEVKTLLTEERSKRRAARLLQRASSRELLLQNTGASSSEDVASGTETTPQRSKQRIVRRTAKQYSSRTSSHQNSTVASTSRTKDRVQRTGGIASDEKEPVIHKRKSDDKTRTNRVSATPSSGKTNTAATTTPVIRCERSSRVERRPPERPGGGSGVGRTRTQHALYVRNNRNRTRTRPRPQCPCV
ncbi:uncharacterized protein LOC142323932 isoform X2 [Lycorma delicatula]|uniref:uncharacterized protein LOC142323932 isoform X2 n=1 Tax=Lycorma delicatula TaxID=130591 RepID=UPI003F50F7FC